MAASGDLQIGSLPIVSYGLRQGRTQTRWVQATAHRKEQPSHLKIIDPTVCTTKRRPVFNAPCITFCPAGVYEEIHDQPKAADLSNCPHCKTCQRKCPFDSIRWPAPRRQRLAIQTDVTIGGFPFTPLRQNHSARFP